MQQGFKCEVISQQEEGSPTVLALEEYPGTRICVSGRNAEIHIEGDNIHVNKRISEIVKKAFKLI
jgi:hypothetical protein